MEREQQFGSWLRASTPNLAKKTVVRVAGYEETEDAKTATDPSHDRNEVAGHEGLDLGSDCTVEEASRSAPEVERGFIAADESGHMVVQEGPMTSTIGPEVTCSTKCPIPRQTEVLSSPVFQAQLDSIEEDLARYDKVEEGRDSDLGVQPGGIGAKVVGSVIFLKNLFTQTEPGGQFSSNSKLSQLVRKSHSEVIELCPAKRMRLAGGGMARGV